MNFEDLKCRESSSKGLGTVGGNTGWHTSRYNVEADLPGTRSAVSAYGYPYAPAVVRTRGYSTEDAAACHTVITQKHTYWRCICACDKSN